MESEMRTRRAPRAISAEESASFLDKFKNEWALFWHSIVGDEPKDDITTEHLQKLSPEQIKQVARTLSQDRRRLNQRMERIKKEIDLSNEVLENLRLVGGDPEETLQKIAALNEVGQQLGTQLERVNAQLRKFRERS